MKLFLLLCVLCAVSAKDRGKLRRSCRSTHEPEVTTPLGQIRGTTLTSRHGKTIFSFRGIRYAETPTGALRFKPPVPAKSWEGVYNATENPPACPQPGVDNISEDCLFLNVFTTELSCTSNQHKPVIAFFHPGGFYEGSCSSLIYGPQYLLDEDVVLVVPNYRLGSLGFLSTGTEEAPGNNGMKDQVTVLEWIKANIASFCGDPNLVTIVGYSAGGLSVTAHLVSPLSRGLFHRAVAMSGSIFGNLPIYTNQSNLATRQARLLNCSDSTPAEIVSCLNTKSIDDFVSTAWDFNEFLYDPIWIWTPVIEPDFGQERFLTEHPIVSVLKGNFAEVPVMLGVTTDEFGSRSFDVVNNETVLKAYDEDYLRVWPIIYTYERHPPLSESISKGLREFYFPNGIDESSRQGVAELYADGVIGFSVNRAAKLLSKHDTQTIFYYLFNYAGRYTHAHYPNTNYTVPYGVSHHDDLLYLFYVSVMTPLFNEPPESIIVDKITCLWSNFAKTGNPIPESTGDNCAVLGSSLWPSFNAETENYMNISDVLVLKERLFDDRYRTWENLIPLSVYDVEKQRTKRI